MFDQLLLVQKSFKMADDSLKIDSSIWKNPLRTAMASSIGSLSLASWRATTLARAFASRFFRVDQPMQWSHSPDFVLSLALGTFLSFMIYLRTRYLSAQVAPATSNHTDDLPLDKNEVAETAPTCPRWEKRQAKRRQGAISPVLIKDAAEKIPPFDGLVTDRSLGGLCVLVKASVPTGTHLNLRNAKSPGMPWVVVEVKTCTQEGIDWRLGCQFLQTPPSVVLWQFD